MVFKKSKTKLSIDDIIVNFFTELKKQMENFEIELDDGDIPIFEEDSVKKAKEVIIASITSKELLKDFIDKGRLRTRVSESIEAIYSTTEYIENDAAIGLLSTALFELIHEQTGKGFTASFTKLGEFAFPILNGTDLIIKVDKIGDFAFLALDKGQIFISNAGGFLGKSMIDGVIMCRHALSFAGDSMEGGTIFILNTCQDPGLNMRGGELITNNAYVGRLEDSEINETYLKYYLDKKEFTTYKNGNETFVGTGFGMTGGLIYIKESHNNHNMIRGVLGGVIIDNGRSGIQSIKGGQSTEIIVRYPDLINSVNCKLNVLDGRYIIANEPRGNKYPIDDIKVDSRIVLNCTEVPDHFRGLGYTFNGLTVVVTPQPNGYASYHLNRNIFWLTPTQLHLCNNNSELIAKDASKYYERITKSFQKFEELIKNFNEKIKQAENVFSQLSSIAEEVADDIGGLMDNFKKDSNTLMDSLDDLQNAFKEWQENEQTHKGKK